MIWEVVFHGLLLTVARDLSLASYVWSTQLSFPNSVYVNSYVMFSHLCIYHSNVTLVTFVIFIFQFGQIFDTQFLLFLLNFTSTIYFGSDLFVTRRPLSTLTLMLLLPPLSPPIPLLPYR